MSGQRKLLKTVGLLGLFVSMGTTSTIIGPTLVDLMYLFGTDYESVSLGAVLRGFGIIPGSILAGYMETKYPAKKDTVITVSFVISVAALFISSFVRYLIFFWIIWTVIGMGFGLFYTVTGNAIRELWEDQFSFYWNVVTVGFSLGGFVTPLIVNPFLLDDSTILNLSNITLQYISTHYEEGTPTNVQYGYIVCGSLCIVTGTVWLIHHIMELFSTEETEQLVNQADNSNTSDVVKIARPLSRGKVYMLIGLLTVYSFCIFGSYFILIVFIRAFSFEHFALDKNTASYVNTTFMMGLMVSPAICVCMLRLSSIKTMFFLFATLHFVVVTVWVLLSGSDLVLHFVLSGLMGITTFSSFTTVPMYFYLLAENGLFMTFRMCARGIADLFFVWITGRYFDVQGPDVTYVFAEVTVSLGAFFAVLVFVIIRY